MSLSCYNIRFIKDTVWLGDSNHVTKMYLFFNTCTENAPNDDSILKYIFKLCPSGQVDILFVYLFLFEKVLNLIKSAILVYDGSTVYTRLFGHNYLVLKHRNYLPLPLDHSPCVC